MVNDKEQAISQVIVDYSFQCEKGWDFSLPRHSGLGAAARHTAFWFVARRVLRVPLTSTYEQRFSEQPQNRGLIWFLGLAYGGQIWPSSAEPPEVAKDMIERIGLSEVASTPALDYLAVGTAYPVPT